MALENVNFSKYPESFDEIMTQMMLTRLHTCVVTSRVRLRRARMTTQAAPGLHVLSLGSCKKPASDSADGRIPAIQLKSLFITRPRGRRRVVPCRKTVCGADLAFGFKLTNLAYRF